MTSHPTAADLQIITRIAVFRGLKPDTVEHIIAPATAVVLAPDEALFHQGDPATAFFIVIDGWVKLYRITLGGEETVIHILTKGDSFAEAVAFTGARYRLRPRRSAMPASSGFPLITSSAAFERARTSRWP